MKTALAAGIFLFAIAAQAQMQASSNPKSENFDKTDKFLPGEEIASPTGQKMKVWSTQGPVKVSKAPEPFEDREKTVIPNGAVVIDATDVMKNPKVSESERLRSDSARDSFDRGER